MWRVYYAYLHRFHNSSHEFPEAQHAVPQATPSENTDIFTVSFASPASQNTSEHNTNDMNVASLVAEQQATTTYLCMTAEEDSISTEVSGGIQGVTMWII